ncbi:MAG: TolC family protein [Candidatus Hydrogenedentes bacterium]|nr:TolC family protein [Candidatus Hydrogenedentota bacterium]
MTVRKRTAWIAVWIICVGLGSVSAEAGKNPAIPELRVETAPGAAEHPSPPALENENRSAEPQVVTASEPITPLNLTVEGAIVMALEHNQNLLVEEVNPAIRQTYVTEQRSAFDPVLVGGYTRTDDRLERDLRVTTTTSLPDIFGTGNITVKEPVETVARTQTDDLTAGITQHLPTGGDISLTVGKSQTKVRNTTSNSNLARGVDTDSDSPSLSLQVTQSLLRGAGLGVNLASLRQARIDRQSSDYELRGVAETLVSQVEQTYWDYVLAQRQIAIYEHSVLVAQSQLDEIEERAARLPRRVWRCYACSTHPATPCATRTSTRNQTRPPRTYHWQVSTTPWRLPGACARTSIRRGS